MAREVTHPAAAEPLGIVDGPLVPKVTVPLDHPDALGAGQRRPATFGWCRRTVLKLYVGT